MRQKLGLLLLWYLRFWAKLQLAKINFWRWLRGKQKIIIIGITGSFGKTSTTQAIATALAPKFLVKTSQGANSESGIPLNILGLKMKTYNLWEWGKVAFLAPIKVLLAWQDFDVYVVEMGIDEPNPPKNMGYLLTIVRPRLGVFLGVSSVHSQQFEKVVGKQISGKARLKAVLAAIGREKGWLIAALPANGLGIVNGDDPIVRQVIGKLTKRAPLVWLKEGQDWWQEKLTLNGCQFAILVGGRIWRIKFQAPLPAVYGLNFAAALQVAHFLKVPLHQATLSLVKNFCLPPGRASLIKGRKGSLIIDSSYNASATATLALLDFFADLSKLTPFRRRVLVLGDMRETGTQAELEHKRIAKKAVGLAEEIVLVGPLMRKYFLPEAKRLGFPKENLYSFLNPWEAAKFLKKHLKGGELILVKGSQNTIFLEIVVEALMAKPRLAQKLLCRRGEFWERKRAELKPKEEK